MYLKRKIDEYLLEWKKNEERLPLIIKGARQIGKTESINHFAEQNYSNIVSINFVLEPKYKTILSDGYAVEDIIKNISMIDTSKRFIAGDTVIDVYKRQQNNLQSRKEFFRSQEARPEYNYEASLEFDASIMGDFEMKGIEEGFVFHLGNRDLEVLDTPGHTKDGICLLDRKYRLLFSGDTVVSTPVLMFDTFSDTMSTYLESLKKLSQLRNSYELIFPGHYLRPIGSIYICLLYTSRCV